MIQAGKFDQRITIQAKTLTKNSIGEDVAAWADVALVWANVMPLRGAAFIAANQEQHTTDARFIIRLTAGLDTTMRILWQGEYYDIKNIIKGTQQWAGTLELQAVKGVRDGR